MNALVKHKTINRLVSISLISQLLISQPVWRSSQREFPTAPVIEGLEWGIVGDLSTLSIFVLLLCLLFKPLNKKLIIALAALFFFLILGDQNRLQPWVYLYLLILLSTAGFRHEKSPDLVLKTVLLILSLSYFWSGIQKLNPFFGIEMFPWLASFTGQAEFLQTHPEVAYCIGITEALAGLSLLFVRIQKIGSIVILGMHLFILISLGPLVHNWNHVVWPWNLCFAGILILLIWIKGEKISFQTSLFKKVYFSICLVLVGLLPLLNLAGKWDHFLSGGFYSSVVSDAIFYYHEGDRTALPKSSKAFQFYNKGTQEEFVLLDQWALDYLDVPMYPEVRIKKQIGKKLCNCVKRPVAAGVRINYKHRFSGESETIEIPCHDL